MAGRGLGEEVQNGRRVIEPGPVLEVVAVEYQVALPNDESVIVRGQAWAGDERRTVLMLHDNGGDLDDWGAVPAVLAATARATVVAVDLPGHGLSDGTFRIEDVSGVVSGLRNQIRPAVAAVMAAGSVATTVFEIAAIESFAGLVLVEPALPADGIDHLARSPRTPKFFVARTKPESTLETARALANRAGGWAVVSTIPGLAGEDPLFDGRFTSRLQEQIAGFLRNCWATAESSR